MKKAFDLNCLIPFVIVTCGSIIEQAINLPKDNGWSPRSVFLSQIQDEINSFAPRLVTVLCVKIHARELADGADYF